MGAAKGVAGEDGEGEEVLGSVLVVVFDGGSVDWTCEDAGGDDELFSGDCHFVLSGLGHQILEEVRKCRC